VKRALLLILVAATTAHAVAGCTSQTPADLPAPQEFEQQLLDQINALRLEEGGTRLTANDCLAELARTRARLLPGADAAPSSDLPQDCGDNGDDYLGENVSRSDQPAHEVVATWAADNLQYPNLVDAQFELAGLGCVGVALDDSTRVALPGEELSGMACSVIFQGGGA
jgi:uncharacterized protein YkwD